ncbi:peptidoglycan-binding protein [Thalassotalea sp. LPB0316]|uniref:peptidoglycan-binding domain-containing protein n=1 Tax=Thalassotalea sp. LPB0316 TaxID=2769490 RepID=UPI0018677280|nr:peptidoglycan-binding domain-containing protein [Thalassotalea sp. LPB0316]QOL25127.1 peptidoglycan-binding protein [Thalassotalea sp. LPB0316]
MLKKIFLPISLSLIAFSSATWSADNNGQFAVDGAGAQQCSIYTNAWEQNTRDLYVFIGWLDGYISSQNQSTENTFDLTPWQTSETMASLVYKACKNAPDDSFLVATIKVLRFIAPTKQLAQTALIKVDVGEQSVYLYQQTIDEIHLKLQALDYLKPGTPSSFGSHSEQALKQFQDKNDLAATGFPDQKTLLMLLLGKVK